jgi:hypothetical protein
MKTDRQIGSKRPHSGKRAVGSPGACKGRLIANLELEFTSTRRKHNPLRISNRKFLRVFRPDSALNFSQLVTQHSSPVTPFLIHGSAIKTPANSQGFNNVQFLIGGKTGASRCLWSIFSTTIPCGRRLRPSATLDSILPCVVRAVASSNRHNRFKLHSKREDFAWPQQ